MAAASLLLDEYFMHYIFCFSIQFVGGNCAVTYSSSLIVSWRELVTYMYVSELEISIFLMVMSDDLAASNIYSIEFVCMMLYMLLYALSLVSS